MTKIRVLRLLEYEFDSIEAMMGHFDAPGLAVPLQGSKRFGEHVKVRSCSITSTFNDEPEDVTPNSPFDT